jgi:hypothetical protein
MRRRRRRRGGGESRPDRFRAGQLTAQDREVEGFTELPLDATERGRGEFRLFEHGDETDRETGARLPGYRPFSLPAGWKAELAATGYEVDNCSIAWCSTGDGVSGSPSI